MIRTSKEKWSLVTLGWLGAALCSAAAGAEPSDPSTAPRAVTVALVQFDSVPEKTEHNLNEM